MTTKIQYKNQWKVPSESDPTKHYTVSQKEDGSFVCHCWPFLRNRDSDCKHIAQVKAGTVIEYDPDEPTFDLVMANVREVTMQPDKKTIYIPLRPIEDLDFAATIAYDLLRLGVRWHLIVEFEHYPKQWKSSMVMAHVYQNGRKIWGPWVKDRGYQGFERISVK